jgi:hypothetical protein
MWVPISFALRLQWPPMKSSGSSIPQPRSRLSGTSTWGLSRPGVRVVWSFPPALFENAPQRDLHEVPSLSDLPRAKRSGRGNPDLGSFYGDTFGISQSVRSFCRGRGRCDLARLPDPFDSDFVRTPLLGLSKDLPSIDTISARPLPGGPPMKKSPSFGSDLPQPELVPPVPFLPASTVFSARQSAGLLRPAADHGVRPVWGVSLV